MLRFNVAQIIMGGSSGGLRGSIPPGMAQTSPGKKMMNTIKT